MDIGGDGVGRVTFISAYTRRNAWGRVLRWSSARRTARLAGQGEGAGHFPGAKETGPFMELFGSLLPRTMRRRPKCDK